MVVKRNDLLQSMRGIAALIVLFGHAAVLTASNSWSLFAAVVFQAHTAVIFFFVLSGFVLRDLVLRLRADGSPLWFIRYAVIRFGRLLPVYWLSTLVGAVVYSACANVHLEGMGWWYYAVSGSPWTLQQLISAMMHLGIDFNGALWSVRVEYWMIVILPPMVLLYGRAPLWLDVCIIGAGCLIGRWLILPALSGSELAFVCYAYCFYLGVALPKIIAASGRLQRFFFSGPAAIAAVLLMMRLAYLVDAGWDWGSTLIADGLLCGVVVAWGHLERPSFGRSLLTIRPLVTLGDISYSFYAYGTPVLALVAAMLVPTLPSWMRHDAGGGAFIDIFCPSVALLILLPLSAQSYRYIEKPGIAGAALVAKAAVSLSRILQTKVRRVAAVVIFPSTIVAYILAMKSN